MDSRSSYDFGVKAPPGWGYRFFENFPAHAVPIATVLIFFGQEVP